MQPDKFALASVYDLASLRDKSFNFTIFQEQEPDYFVPEAACAAADRVDQPEGLLDGFVKSRRETPPRSSLTYLRDCYVLPNAAIVTSSGHVLRESCFPYSSPWLTQFFSPWIQESPNGDVTVKLDPVEAFPGRVVYVREHGEQGFFHWMHSVFPRVETLRRHNFGADYALLYKAEQQFQKEGLCLAGLADWPVIAPTETAVQHFAELVFPSPLVQGGDFWLRSTTVGRFYDSLAVPPAYSPRRLYITRQGAEVRRLRNEPNLLEFLSRHGFAVIEAESLTFAEQLATFRNCEFMLGVHGAGLSHAVSMAPGSRLLEILHPRRFWATYRAISARRGISYGFVVGDDPGVEVAGDTFDFDVNIKKLIEVFAKMAG